MNENNAFLYAFHQRIYNPFRVNSICDHSYFHGQKKKKKKCGQLNHLFYDSRQMESYTQILEDGLFFSSFEMC